MLDLLKTILSLFLFLLFVLFVLILLGYGAIGLCLLAVLYGISELLYRLN